MEEQALDLLHFANLLTGEGEARQTEPDPMRGAWFFSDWSSAVHGAAAGLANCFSLEMGETDDSVIARCGDFFEQFAFVGLVPRNSLEDSDALTERFKATITAIPLLILDYRRLGECKSTAEYYTKYGAKAFEKLLYSARELPAYGLLNIAKVTPLDVLHMPRVLSGIHELDRAIGGFLMGDVSIWTGKRGDGKSTILSQLMIEARDRGRTVCAYSGELRADRFKDWLYLQAAGPEHIVTKHDEGSGRDLHMIDALTRNALDEWMDGKLFLYDLSIETAHDADSILKIFEYASRRYGCTVFLVDNIMTCRFKGATEANFYREQSSFVGRLVEFAIKHKAHVHIVAHPRKTQGEIKDSDEVSGISDITNRAGNVFSLSRLPEDKAQERGYDTVLSVLKNRAYGEKAKIGLCFEPRSRRFYKALTGTPNKKYGWESAGKQEDFEEVAGETNVF